MKTLKPLKGKELVRITTEQATNTAMQTRHKSILDMPYCRILEVVQRLQTLRYASIYWAAIHSNYEIIKSLWNFMVNQHKNSSHRVIKCFGYLFGFGTVKILIKCSSSFLSRKFLTFLEFVGFVKFHEFHECVIKENYSRTEQS